MARRIRKARKAKLNLNICSVKGCYNKPVAMGFLSPDMPVGAKKQAMCLKHHQERMRKLDAEQKLKHGQGTRDGQGKWRGCVACDETWRKVVARSMCDRCYQRWYRKNRNTDNAYRCLEEGCNKPVHAQSLCKDHYHKWWYAQAERKPCAVPYCERPAVVGTLCPYHQKKKRAENETRTCSIEGCDKPFFGKGLCNSHYNYKWNWEKRNSTPWTVCSMKDCTLTATVDGLCPRCYAEKHQTKRWRATNRAKQISQERGDVCSAFGCDDWVYAKGFCEKHYNRDYKRRRRENG